MTLFLANILLAIAWGAMTGSFDVFNLTFGFVLGAFALALIREQLGTDGYFGRGYRVIGLVWLFLKELVKSAVKVAVTVLTPRLDLKPGIIAFPLTLERDIEITLLANLITLTPGTLSIDVSDDRKTLYVHCIDVPDVDAAIADIRDGFERRIREVFR
jgi:multicomponent Na+:H+ antiporter subunit E